MANEEDECDSTSLFTLASQSDVTSFLHAQAAKITGLNSSLSDADDDDSSMDGSLLARFTQVPNHHSKPYLSRSCFASISSSSNPVDDLTELKWLNTFKFKDFKDDINNNEFKEKRSSDEDRIGQLSNELKTDDINNDSISFGVLIFLALYSKRDDKFTPWSLTIKQIFEYIQLNIKQIINRRGWKNLVKQTLMTVPCFSKIKHDIIKSRSIWTIDSYYRPLLTRAYLSSPAVLQTNKTLSEGSTNGSDDKQIPSDTTCNSQSIVSNFAPKATVKTKALSRLYERLCEEKMDNGDEADSNGSLKRQDSSTLASRNRPRSTSSLDHRQSIKDNKEKRLSSSSPWTTKLNEGQNHHNSDIELKPSTSNRRLSVVTPCPSLDHTYLNEVVKRKSSGSIEYSDPSTDDERDSSSSIHPIRKSVINTRAQTAARDSQKLHNNDSLTTHRRKSSPPRKRSSLILPSHRPNTRINRRIIEQDLKLLRQANVTQPLDLSIVPSSSFEEPTIDKLTPIEGVLDLSLSYF